MFHLYTKTSAPAPAPPPTATIPSAKTTRNGQNEIRCCVFVLRLICVRADCLPSIYSMCMCVLRMFQFPILDRPGCMNLNSSDEHKTSKDCEAACCASETCLTWVFKEQAGCWSGNIACGGTNNQVCEKLCVAFVWTPCGLCVGFVWIFCGFYVKYLQMCVCVSYMCTFRWDGLAAQRWLLSTPPSRHRPHPHRFHS